MAPDSDLVSTLRSALEARPEVREAYLFGSRARGDHRPSSDVDVAVYVDPPALEAPGFGYEAELGAALQSALRRSDVDIVVLNERHASVSAGAYLATPELQWAVERGLLICAQNVFDIAAHLAASAGRDSPDYASSIDALASLGVLPAAFASALRPLAGFRNVLVHAYLTVDPLRVHEVLTQRLPEQRSFAGHVERYLDTLPSA